MKNKKFEPQELIKPFELMTPEEQRITMAKDALYQIKKGIFNPGSGYGTIESGNENVRPRDELKEVLPKIVCTGCAKTALFLAHIARFNESKITAKNDISANEARKIRPRLVGIFGDQQLDMIESAYEARVIVDRSKTLKKKRVYGIGSTYTELGNKATKFGLKYRDRKVRLVEILKNIVKHGEFKP